MIIKSDGLLCKATVYFQVLFLGGGGGGGGGGGWEEGEKYKIREYIHGFLLEGVP